MPKNSLLGWQEDSVFFHSKGMGAGLGAAGHAEIVLKTLKNSSGVRNCDACQRARNLLNAHTLVREAGKWPESEAGAGERARQLPIVPEPSLRGRLNVE